MGALIPILTTVVGMAFNASGRGDNKAQPAGPLGAILFAFFPLVEAFQSGLLDGAGDGFTQLGFAIGAAITGWIVNRVVIWLAPANGQKA